MNSRANLGSYHFEAKFVFCLKTSNVQGEHAIFRKGCHEILRLILRCSVSDLLAYFAFYSGLRADERKSASSDNSESEDRYVQIHGKWHKYRPDNRYVIDGVPTYYATKKHEVQKGKPTKNANFERSQKLARQASENPLAVYTPTGMKTLKEGLDAVQNNAAERKKAIEELDRD